MYIILIYIHVILNNSPIYKSGYWTSTNIPMSKYPSIWVQIPSMRARFLCFWRGAFLENVCSILESFYKDYLFTPLHEKLENLNPRHWQNWQRFLCQAGYLSWRNHSVHVIKRSHNSPHVPISFRVLRLRAGAIVRDRGVQEGGFRLFPFSSAHFPWEQILLVRVHKNEEIHGQSSFNYAWDDHVVWIRTRKSSR